MPSLLPATRPRCAGSPAQASRTFDACSVLPVECEAIDSNDMLLGHASTRHPVQIYMVCVALLHEPGRGQRLQLSTNTVRADKFLLVPDVMDTGHMHVMTSSNEYAKLSPPLLQ